MTHRPIIAAIGILAGLCAVACGTAVRPVPQRTTALQIFAAASLTDAFKEIASTFEREHPGLVVRMNSGGSQQLAMQIEQEGL